MTLINEVSRNLNRFGLSEFVRKAWGGKTRFVLVMHGVASQKYTEVKLDKQPDLTRSDLISILEWIRLRYKFLSPEEFLYTDFPGILITFDDGFANNFTQVIPVLERFNAPAIFFVTLQHVLEPDNWLPATRKLTQNSTIDLAGIPTFIKHDLFDGMSCSQLVECTDHPLITIGSHTLTHPFLSDCTEVELENEIVRSKFILEQITGKSVKLFAYPTGDYDSRSFDYLQSAGYVAAFAADSKKLGYPHFEIPRIGIYASDEGYLSMKFSGFHRLPLKSKAIIQK